VPTQKKFKQKVRARQERDGVSYSEARRIEDRKPIQTIASTKQTTFENAAYEAAKAGFVREPTFSSAAAQAAYEAGKAPLTQVQEHELRRQDALRTWAEGHPGPHEVRLKVQYNEHGTAEVAVDVLTATGDSASFSTIGPSTYLEAIALAVADTKQAQNPRDDLGDLLSCS
jgi:hypothetical protein